MLAEQFDVARISAARNSSQPYLRWVENAAMAQDTAGALRIKLEKKLDDYAGDIRTPNHLDEPRDYLAKASVAYLDACLRHHSQKNDGAHDPDAGMGRWLKDKGRVWLINDERQTLTTAMHHGYSHASAQLEGKPVKSEYEMLRVGDFNPRPNSPHR